MDTLFAIREAAAYLGVSQVTLRRWEREQRIKPALRTAGGMRRYTKASLDAILGLSAPARHTIAYARVSSHDQRADLVRQGERLRDYCSARGWSFDLIEDLGSGLNYHKPGLRKLLAAIHAGEVERLVLTHKDRLLRFGADLIFDLCERQGVEVEIIETTEHLGFEVELSRDVIELMTVFSAKLYGARSHKAKRAEALAKEAVTQ